jgi:hypothetical protein
MKTERLGETSKCMFATLVTNASTTWRTIGQELVEWHGKVPPTQQTWLYKQSILILNFYFPTATCFGPHGTFIRQYYDRKTKLFELQNMDPYLVQHFHIRKLILD